MILLLAAALAQEPQALDEASRTVELRAMTVLGSWATLNMVSGTAGYFTAEKPELQGFHAMNAAWNTVNAGLVVGSLLGGRNRDTSSLEAVEKRRRTLHNTLRINLALDVVYVGSGVATILLARRLDRPMAEGIGASLIVQGGFLALFDLTFLHAHVQVGNGLTVKGRF